jgi:hypothetical protein
LEGNDIGERSLEMMVKALPSRLSSLSLSKCSDKVVRVGMLVWLSLSHPL